MKSAIIAVVALQVLSCTMATPVAIYNTVRRSSDKPQRTSAKFENHDGYVCRGPGGKHDNERHYYERISATPKECRQTCEHLDWCTGYEIGKDHHCELWETEIGTHLERKRNYSCYVKEAMEPDLVYDEESGYACRGLQGSHDSKEHYYETKRLSAKACRNECNQHDWCTGYETEKDKHCELWTETIGDHLEKKRGLSCYIKHTDIVVGDHCEVGKVKSISGSNAVDITFENQLVRPVVVSWIDYNYESEQYNTLEARESYTQSTYETHPWTLTGDDNRLLLEDFIVGGNSCADNKKSKFGDNKSAFSIHNSGTHTMDLYWLDYNGKSVHYGTMHSKDTIKIDTFATHPWYIMAGGKTIVQWTATEYDLELTADGQEQYRVVIQ